MISSYLASNFLERDMDKELNPAHPPDGLGAGSGSDPERTRLEALGNLAESMVHDFNNILAAISGFAEMIQLHSDKEATGRLEDVSRLAGFILQATEAGKATVKDLGRAARPRVEPKSVFCLDDLIDRAVSIARGALPESISLIRSRPATPIRISGYGDRIVNAIVNLILNARDAMPCGGRIRLDIELANPGNGRTESAPDIAIITILDDGCGMPAEVLQRIFQRKFTTKGKKGSGLGLWNVQKMAEQHQGWITVESEPNKGSEFRIHLPALSSN